MEEYKISIDIDSLFTDYSYPIDTVNDIADETPITGEELAILEFEEILLEV